MASPPSDNLLQVTVNYERNRVVLHLQKSMKVGTAIQKAAEKFKVDPRGLTFLYHGAEITDDMTVETALGKANVCTVIHLIQVSSKKQSTAVHRPVERESVLGFCKTCDGLSLTREIFLCPDCRHSGLFMRSSAEQVNHFSSSIDPAILRGSCSTCKKDGLQAQIQFECIACSASRRELVGVLRQIRDNTQRQIPCMKCGKAEEDLFRFACSSRHCMCLECFSKWCQHQMNARKFRNFGDSGYSVGCPGPGNDCSSTPVPDPHHFQLVNENRQFYKVFQDRAMEEFQPPGNDGVFCSKCNIIVHTGNSSEVEVKEPEGATPVVSGGLSWYQKLWSKPRPQAPRKRLRTSCSRCQLPYCVQCKQVWHEGDCRKMNSDMEREEQAFPIDPVRAKASCWPRNED